MHEAAHNIGADLLIFQDRDSVFENLQCVCSGPRTDQMQAIDCSTRQRDLCSEKSPLQRNAMEFPATAVPMGLSAGKPVGVQIISLPGRRRQLAPKR